jgi:hypothetical protein
MREKHSKRSIFAFTFTTIFLFGVFMCIPTQAFAEKGYKGKGNQKEWQKQNEQHKEYRKHRKHYEEEGRHDYKKYPDYRKHQGYRERPYDKRRYYGHHNYKGRRYDYHGHWRSWEQWDRYVKKHPDIRKHGIYYREGAHLMFRFCEPGTGNCFFFSIGK